MKKLLYIGDSLIELFDWRARFYGHDVVNLGRAGETVEGLLSRAGEIVRAYPCPDLVFVMTGINNVTMEDFGFLDSYRKILDRFSVACPPARIFVHSLLPTLPSRITNESILDVNRSLAKIAEGKGVKFIDLYWSFIDETGQPIEDYLMEDGIHLSDEGYAVWAEELEKIIEQ